MLGTFLIFHFEFSWTCKGTNAFTPMAKTTPTSAGFTLDKSSSKLSRDDTPK